MSKTALVLAGGGSRGSYQIGVWQALRELSIDIDIVTGTSVGALNAALITIGDFENALALWKSIRTDMVLDMVVDETLPLEKRTIAIIKAFLSDYVRQGGTDSYPLKRLINEYVDEDVIRNSSTACGIIVVDKSSLKPKELYIEDIGAGQLSDYLLASSSLFPAMKTCKIDGIDFMDGGYYDNLPVELAMKKSADRIIAVDLEAIGIVRRGTLKLATDITIIKSHWNLGTILVFDNETILRNIRLGYLDAMKAFGVYDGIAYSFIKGEVPAFIRHNRQRIKLQNDVFGLTNTVGNQSLKDGILYLKIAAYVRLRYKKQLAERYTDFLKVCMEAAGELFSIDYTKIYSISIFNKLLSEKINVIEVPFIEPTKFLDIKNLKETMRLLDKKVRTLYFAYSMKRSVDTDYTIDPLIMTFIASDEMLAAYYLALLD